MSIKSLQKISSLLVCPKTHDALIYDEEHNSLVTDEYTYPIIDGIPSLFAPNDPVDFKNDVTDVVREFYEEDPFPNYEELDTAAALKKKSQQGAFASMLDTQLSKDAVVLEAGCGTGQFSNFLALRGSRTVIGGDLCLNSLRLATEFKNKNDIKNVTFLHMNLFHPPFKDESFDMILSNGVLHHTGDPRRGFTGLVKKLKPGGIIMIGLYNSYGHLPTLWKRKLFDLFGQKLFFLDHRLVKPAAWDDRARAWWKDQYQHPHESSHSQGEVLGWFKEENIEFLFGLPRPDLRPITGSENMFSPHPKGTLLERFYTQMSLLLNGGKDSGLFIMIGKKRDDNWVNIPL